MDPETKCWSWELGDSDFILSCAVCNKFIDLWLLVSFTPELFRDLSIKYRCSNTESSFFLQLFFDKTQSCFVHIALKKITYNLFYSIANSVFLSHFSHLHSANNDSPLPSQQIVCCVAQASLKIIASVYFPQPPECWDSRCAPLCWTGNTVFDVL